jgi:hypothetical protein
MQQAFLHTLAFAQVLSWLLKAGRVAVTTLDMSPGMSRFSCCAGSSDVAVHVLSP